MSEKKEKDELDEIFDLEFPLFEMQATFDVSKHLGGVKATDKLLKLCNIDQNSKILDLGCGVGATTSYIAKKYKTKIIGVDKSERMVQKAIKRISKKKLTNLVDLRIADAINLPFEDNSFDIVITESVLSFVENKEKAISELIRVTKSGGYIGLNESILLTKSIPNDLRDVLVKSEWFRGQVMTEEDWNIHLEKAGFENVHVESYPIKLGSEFSNHIQRYGWKHFLKNIYNSFKSALTSKRYREYVKEVRSIPKELPKYIGYGLFVSKKP